MACHISCSVLVKRYLQKVTKPGIKENSVITSPFNKMTSISKYSKFTIVTMSRVVYFHMTLKQSSVNLAISIVI